jgi:hypothetical protein
MTREQVETKVAELDAELSAGKFENGADYIKTENLYWSLVHSLQFSNPEYKSDWSWIPAAR